MSTIIGHLVKRGVGCAQRHFHGPPSPEMMDKLQHDAQLYENAGPEGEVKPQELLPVIITGVLVLLLIASVRYTMGAVMASLAMIESPSSTAIIEPKPPAYSTIEPDAPLEKEPLMSAEEADVEVTVINHKPITSKVKTTIKHLHRIGGFRARWRGLGLSILYHFAHSALTHFLAGFLGFGLFGYSLVYIIVSICTARLHMIWTHTMIAYPSSKPWYRRFPSRKGSRALLLPSLVFAVAQQATFLIPVAVADTLGLTNVSHEDLVSAAHRKDYTTMALLAIRFLAVPLTALFIAVAVLLPAAVTLTRIEAVLLPEDQQTIVPFDKAAMTSDIDLTTRGGSRALFVQAWRSYDYSARLRLVNLYLKMVLIQAVIAIAGFHLAAAELYIIGGERLTTFFKSAAAQLHLMAIEAKQNAN